jgi:hypothetical protein
MAMKVSKSTTPLRAVMGADVPKTEAMQANMPKQYSLHGQRRVLCVSCLR